MQPLSYYASAEQRAATAYGGLFWRGDPQQESLAARCRMLRYTYNMTRCETSISTPLIEAQQESQVVLFACFYSESSATLAHLADAQQGTRPRRSCLALLLVMALLS